MHVTNPLLLLLAATSVCAPLQCARGDDPGFFPKNYVGAALGNQSSQKQRSKHGSTSSSWNGQGANSSAGQEGDGWDSVNTSGSSSSSVDIAPNIDPPSAIPILAVDGVVSFADLPHARDVVNDMISMTEQHHIHFRKLYAVGPFEDTIMSMDAKHRDAFYALTTNVIEAKKPPGDLDLKGSPSWIFYTARGRYIAEGIDALDKLTTVSGKLIWPDKKTLAEASSSSTGQASSSNLTPAERMKLLQQKLKAQQPS